MEQKSKTEPQITDIEQKSKTEPQKTENSSSSSSSSSSTDTDIEVGSMIETVMKVMDRHMLRDSWTGPFSSKEQRLRSYEDCQWPRDVKTTPDALSEAGFYATGK